MNYTLNKQELKDLMHRSWLLAKKFYSAETDEYFYDFFESQKNQLKKFYKPNADIFVSNKEIANKANRTIEGKLFDKNPEENYIRGYKNGARWMRKILNNSLINEEENTEWISVSKKNPKSGEKVLVYCLAKHMFDDEIYDFEIQVGYIEGIGEWYLNSKDLDRIHLITHWRPLPNEPK